MPIFNYKHCYGISNIMTFQKPGDRVVVYIHNNRIIPRTLLPLGIYDISMLGHQIYGFKIKKLN